MRQHTATAKTLLARIGMSDGAELFDLTQGAVTSGEQKAVQRLAHAAWMAITRIDDAERHANNHLGDLDRYAAEQRTQAEQGYARNAMWIAQAATRYQEQVDAIKAHAEAFNAAANPLALLLGLPVAE